MGEAAKEAVPALRKVLEDWNQDVVWWASIAIASIARADDVVPILEQAINTSTNDYLRERAIEARKMIDSTRYNG